MSAFALIAERDLDWVSSVIDVVAQTVGLPWRDALDRLDDLQRAAQPNAPRRFSAVVGAIQRLAGGRTPHIRAAREARSLVLGHPVFSAIERQARIGWAAEQLGTTPSVVESMLWSDLPRERPVELPDGRPTELEVAAFANVALIQRALRRAQSCTLHIVGDAGPILRAAAHRGLLATATIGAPGSSTHVGTSAESPTASSTQMHATGEPPIDSRAHVGANAIPPIDSRAHVGANAIPSSGPPTHVGANAIPSSAPSTHVAATGEPPTDSRADVGASPESPTAPPTHVGTETTIEIVGPLALFHRTNVYGRALADLAPMLGELRDFTLDIHVETQTALYTTRVESPVLLPAPPSRLAGVPYSIARLARELARAAPELELTPVPPLVAAGHPIAGAEQLVQRGGRRGDMQIVRMW
jgi:hypothetical protein